MRHDTTFLPSRPVQKVPLGIRSFELVTGSRARRYADLGANGKSPGVRKIFSVLARIERTRVVRARVFTAAVLLVSAIIIIVREI